MRRVALGAVLLWSCDNFAELKRLKPHHVSTRAGKHVNNPVDIVLFDEHAPIADVNAPELGALAIRPNEVAIFIGRQKTVFAGGSVQKVLKIDNRRVGE